MFCENNKNKCKKQVYSNLFCKKYCYKHFLLNYNRHAIIIQKAYIGYRTRKKLKNIYLKLPNDLQSKILSYLNGELYYKKYCKTLQSIINNKTLKIFDYNIKIDIEYLYTTFYLYNKYHQILCKNKSKFLYSISVEVILMLYNIYYDNTYSINSSVHGFFEYNLIEIKINNKEHDYIIAVIKSLYNYRTLYEKFYILH